MGPHFMISNVVFQIIDSWKHKELWKYGDLVSNLAALLAFILQQ
jgi:hypothetical protein